MAAPEFRLYVRTDGSTFIVGRTSASNRYVIVGEPGSYRYRYEAVAVGYAMVDVWPRPNPSNHPDAQSPLDEASLIDV